MEGCIQKQEERSLIRDLSPVPSVHSSVRVDPKLPSFEELKSDDKIQMELQKRLYKGCILYMVICTVGGPMKVKQRSSSGISDKIEFRFGLYFTC